MGVRMSLNDWSFFFGRLVGRHSDISQTSEVMLGDDKQRTNVPILTANHAGVKWLRKGAN